MMENKLEKRPNFKDRVLERIFEILEPDEAKEAIWGKEGFDLEQRLREIKKPFIEVGGPTHARNYKAVDKEAIRKERGIYSSNLQEGGNTGKEKLDFFANGRDLPILDESVGVVLCAGLCLVNEKNPDDKWFVQRRQLFRPKKLEKETNELKKDVMKEAYRVIQDKGLLIWGGRESDIEIAKKIGFDPTKIIKHTYKNGDIFTHCVFEKK